MNRPGKGRPPALGWLNGFALGLLIGVGAFCVVLAGIDTVPKEYFHLYLIAALTVGGTILAAWIALKSVQAQVHSAIEIADGQRQRELRASAALLPLALSRFVATCEHNIRRHFVSGQLIGEQREFGGSLQVIDDDVLRAIRDCIVHVDDASHEHLLYLFRAYQVLLARDLETTTFFLLSDREEETNYEIEHRASDAINWAVLHAAASGIFAFARGETNSISAYDPTVVRNAFAQAGIVLEAYPLVHRKIEEGLAKAQIGLRFITRGW